MDQTTVEGCRKLDAYSTRDFEFVATLKAIPDLLVDLALLVPYRHYASPRGKNLRFTMHLVVRGKDGNYLDAVRVIGQLRSDYLNDRLRVNPRSLFSAVRSLRSAMTDEQAKINAGKRLLDEDSETEDSTL